MIRRAGVFAALVIFAAGCDDGMDSKRQWCHDRGGYIANTGWYEWKCVINNTPVYLPSPKDSK